MWAETLRHIGGTASVFGGVCLEWLRTVAAFIASDDPYGRLIREFIFTVLIAVGASLLVDRFRVWRERAKRRKEEGPIRELVIDAVAYAHAQVLETIFEFNALNYRRVSTRSEHLGARLTSIRTVLSTASLSGLAYFESDERAALAKYMGNLKWPNCTTYECAVAWAETVNGALKGVQAKCAANSLVPWDAEQLETIKVAFRRLTAEQGQGSSQAIVASVPDNGGGQSDQFVMRELAPPDPLRPEV